MTAVFPFTAIVGQDELIEALLINAVAPDVGGVLIRGERGNAKTTAVRALAELMAPSPLVEVPLGATLDRLVGALDLRGALAGEHRFERGLLGRAHEGILYVDEVNLLADHLVDALLDAAATGVVRVEREAVSVVDDARFLLVGTMNVEEGELRPQLLDRFGLGIEVLTPADPLQRAEIVRRRLAFEADPVAFAERFAAEQAALAERITAARNRYAVVRLPERELMRITRACAELGVDGVRGDIVTARAARALAALDGLDEVTEDHVRRGAVMALAHRRRRDPLDGGAPDPGELQRALDLPPDDHPPPGPPPTPEGDTCLTSSKQSDDGMAPERVDAPAAARLPSEALSLPARPLRTPGPSAGAAGRRARSSGPGAGAVDSRPASDDADDLALVATLRARLLGAEPDHVREHIRSGREGALVCLVVDASGSMGARRRAARVKGALLELLRDAYQRRDRVAVIAFRDASAQVLVAPGAPLERAAAALAALPTGGRTPLAEGLRVAAEVVRRERQRRAIALVLTDGRVTESEGAVAAAAAALGRACAGGQVHVIDTEDGPVRVGIAAAIARAAGGGLHQLMPSRRAA